MIIGIPKRIVYFIATAFDIAARRQSPDTIRQIENHCLFVNAQTIGRAIGWLVLECFLLGLLFLFFFHMQVTFVPKFQSRPEAHGGVSKGIPDYFFLPTADFLVLGLGGITVTQSGSATDRQFDPQAAVSVKGG